MATDQRRRRLHSSTSVGYSFQEQMEQYRAKKMKLGFQQDELNMRSNISLEWNDKNKSVVAKREQVGISQRYLVPFIDAVAPHSYSRLGDILTVPREIFELENLANVLSYEVWQTCIAETERNILAQLLPIEVEPEMVVQELLSGDNFHFGNPFLKWGSSLCSGRLHPDDVLQWEQCIKANKRTYFSELQKYHNDMIVDLQMWKDKWDRCKDPEEEVLPKIWRSRRQTSKSIQLSEIRYNDLEENNVATPDSCSWATFEKACSNDNSPNLPGDSLGRKGFSDSTLNNSSDGMKVVAKLKNGEKLQKRNIQLGDGAKYMSYIKVSKEQHQRVKRTMKHPSNSIQPRSLNNVLGNLDALHVQPFEVFEEEERQKLHDYWLQLSNNDIPAGYANWIKKKMKAQQMVKCLGQELEEKLECGEEDDEKDNSHNLLPDLTDDVEAMVSPNASVQEDVEDKKTDNLLLKQTPNGTENMEVGNDSVSLSVEEDHEEKIASISGWHQVNDLTLDSHDSNVIAKANDLPHIVSEHPGNMNHVDIPVCQGDPPESADYVWSAVSVPGCFFHSACLGHQYVSPSELSFAHPQVMEDQPARIINVEMDALEKDSGRGNLLHRDSCDPTFFSSFPNQQRSVLQEKNDRKQMLHGQPDDVSFFGAYPTEDRNALLESFFKRQGGGLQNHQEQRRMGMDFDQPGNLMMENGQFSSQFRDQADISLALDARQKKMNVFFVDHNIQDSMYSNEGSTYSIPKHLPINVQEWGVSTVSMRTPQSHSNGGDLVSQNWFPGEHRAQGGWSGLEGAVASSRSIGRESIADQSLCSVLSECNELHSGAPAPYDTLGSAEQFMFMQSGMYSGLGGGIPSTSNILQQTADPLNYFSLREASVGRKTNNLGWMNMSNQNSGL
ncbi:hypothetical protein ACH5RR_010901 [Cinchona calisaya]|uniref:DEUBAD domain-containing protein n=1 Tax=Cinchona calisaya TaxID=153742 RepID=A0ABD3A6T8_9GENT